MIIDDYLAWLQDSGRTEATIRARDHILRRIESDLPYGLEQATADELRGWIYRDDWSASTRKTYYNAVVSFFAFATRPADPILDYNPANLLPKPPSPRGLPRPVTDEQLADLLERAAEPYRTWAVLAAYAGLRCIEIARLDRADVTADQITIRKGKGGRPGVVPTHPMVWAAVRDLPPGPLALTDRGEQANAQWVSIRTALHFRRDLRMPGVALHRLRHWCGTTVYRRTRDIRVTQEILRHSSPATTAVYTLVSSEERRKAVHALPTVSSALS